MGWKRLTTDRSTPAGYPEAQEMIVCALQVAAGFLILIVPALSLVFVWRPGIFSPGRRPTISVAVMPFRVAAGDPALDFVTAGLSEGLSFRLSQLKGLRLPSSAEVEQIANTGSAYMKSAGNWVLIAPYRALFTECGLQHLQIHATVDGPGEPAGIDEPSVRGRH